MQRPRKATRVEFVVTLSGAHHLQITVDWAASDGTAEVTNDYASNTSSGTITFAPGETEQTISVSTLEDIIPERDEAFTVTLSNPVQVKLPTPATATGTITNDDDLPVVTILPYETPILEGNNPKFIVSRQGLTDDRVDIQLSLTKDGGTLPDATVVIPVGQYSAIHTVNHARDQGSRSGPPIHCDGTIQQYQLQHRKPRERDGRPVGRRYSRGARN